MAKVAKIAKKKNTNPGGSIPGVQLQPKRLTLLTRVTSVNSVLRVTDSLTHTITSRASCDAKKLSLLLFFLVFQHSWDPFIITVFQQDTDIIIFLGPFFPSQALGTPPPLLQILWIGAPPCHLPITINVIWPVSGSQLVKPGKDGRGVRKGQEKYFKSVIARCRCF